MEQPKKMTVLPVLIIVFQVISAVVPVLFLVMAGMSGNLTKPDGFGFVAVFAGMIVCCVAAAVLAAIALRRGELRTGAGFWLLVACIVVVLALYVFAFIGMALGYTQSLQDLAEGRHEFMDLGPGVWLVLMSFAAPGTLSEAASLVMAIVLRRASASLRPPTESLQQPND